MSLARVSSRLYISFLRAKPIPPHHNHRNTEASPTNSHSSHSSVNPGILIAFILPEVPVLVHLARLFGMGNFASCTLARIPKVARLVLPDGAVRLFRPPATAAELMLAAPGHFLADARALQAGRRITALAADEDLEHGGVYTTFPMKRLGSEAAPADLARLATVFAREARARKPASAKVASDSAPATEDDAPVKAPGLDEMSVDDEAAAAEIEELKQRISCGRLSRRRPTLETIQEESYATAVC
uniref:Uncharacterized protein n=1 Tax=Avena sativa TaxID=4498 RepID=A0ACD5VPS2_AVESA